ncbi:MAG: circadian clock KaiB family protein [Phycisphaerae bacterium]
MTDPRGSTSLDTRPPEYRLILFVAGEEPNSRAARENLNQVCTSDLHGRCHVCIVDVLEDFAAAAKHQVLVTPTLLVTEPEPSVMVIGNLSDHKKVRRALRLEGS